MPSLQVVDLSNPEPQQNYVGEFARSFGESLNAGRQKKSDEDIFKRIKQQYPSDSPDQTAQRLLESTASAPFKKDTLGYLSSLATNQARRQDQDIRNETNKINRIKATNQSRALDQTQDNQKTKLPTEIAKYNKSIWKDAEPEELSLFNRLTSKYIEDGLPLNQASEKALGQVKEINEALDIGMQEKIGKTTKEYLSLGFLDSSNERMKAEKLVVDQTKALLESGAPEERVKKALKKAKWNPEEIKKILEEAKSSKQSNPEQPQSEALYGGQQGQTSQVAGIDDILFGG